MLAFVADAFSSESLLLDDPLSGSLEVYSCRLTPPDSLSLDDTGIRTVILEVGCMVDFFGVSGPCERSRKIDLDASKLAFLSFSCSILFLRINEL